MMSHLHEERLFDCYWTARGGEALDPPAAEHLADCQECAARFGELARFLDALRDEGYAEVDALYSADDLRQQQQQIARRLESVGRSARVLTFPHATAARQLPVAGRRPFPRWVAATAAAGLLAGVAAGMFFKGTGDDLPVGGLHPQATQSASSAYLAPSDEVTVDSGTDSGHEFFMSELELAADRPRTAELEAYDELTPHIREVRLSFAGR